MDAITMFLWRLLVFLSFLDWTVFFLPSWKEEIAIWFLLGCFVIWNFGLGHVFDLSVELWSCGVIM